MLTARLRMLYYNKPGILIWQKQHSYKLSFQYVKNCFSSKDRHKILKNVVLESGHDTYKYIMIIALSTENMSSMPTYYIVVINCSMVLCKFIDISYNHGKIIFKNIF